MSISTGERLLFRLPHLELHHGAVALVGRNGSGKSTFIRAMLGEHNHYDGRIEIMGRAVHAYRKEDLAKVVSVVFPNPQLFGNHSASEVMMLGRLPYQSLLSRVNDSDNLLVFRAAQEMEIEHLLERRFQELSDGEKQLVMIGRAIVQDTPVLLMDEPSAFLDIVYRKKLMDVIRKISGEGGKLVIFSTHQSNFLSETCYKVLLIDEQEMRALSDPLTFEADIHQTFFPAS